MWTAMSKTFAGHRLPRNVFPRAPSSGERMQDRDVLERQAQARRHLRETVLAHLTTGDVSKACDSEAFRKGGRDQLTRHFRNTAGQCIQ